MRLVVDASVLVGELLRSRGLELLAKPHLELYVAAHTWNETTHELPRRLDILGERQGLADKVMQNLALESLQLARRYITVQPLAVYAEFEKEALWRVPRDPEDWPSVALGIVLSAGIWTQDQDYFGCGLPTWTTDVLSAYLESLPK
jgi:predicted nucleic acid-binding protein